MSSVPQVAVRQKPAMAAGATPKSIDTSDATRPAPMRKLQPASRKPPTLLIGAVVLVLIVAVAGWWTNRPGHVATVQPAPAPVAVVAAPPVIAPGAPVITELPLPSTPEPAATVPITAAAQLAAQALRADRLKARREAEARRKVELDTQRKSDEELRAKADEAERGREADARARQAELARQAKAAVVERKTPQQMCADRPNFISRGICEAHQCDKTEYASLPFCVDMHERRAPKDYTN
ncbi:hypothetical protein [Actimicrobium sp. GrIS 1.19]|uniref:hypothetical protein n=1 Tax=Actimicrobium sp. GrIS 1.19 TaxID=3071708 RepID=UPI002E104E5D